MAQRNMPNGTAASPVALNTMAVGEKGSVVRISAVGELGRRIRDMGIIPGCTVCVTGRAPLNDPLSIRLSGYTLSLRGTEAAHILVEREHA